MSAGTTTTTVGILGGRWRGEVDVAGRVTVRRGGGLAWWVAAEDRWHDPAVEATVRQRRVEGTPVVETRVRVPSGDVVQRVYAVADHGGITLVEFENESPASVAIALSHGRLLTARPPALVPIEGIEVPDSAVSFPLGHRATLRVGIAHDGSTGTLPADLPTALAVARGWMRRCDAASRLAIPDTELVEQVVAQRCALLLEGPVDGRTDAAATMIGYGELVRMGADAVDLVPDAVTAAERLAKSARTCGLSWDGAAGLAAVERLLVAAGDGRGAADVRAVRARLGGDGAPAPVDAPTNALVIPWVEQRLARPAADGRCVLLPDGFPAAWLGVNWEVHHVPAGAESTVSYAVRWHGDRPALLWEVHGAPVLLAGGTAAPEWSSDATQGEALWPANAPV